MEMLEPNYNRRYNKGVGAVIIHTFTMNGTTINLDQYRVLHCIQLVCPLVI